MYNRYIPQNDGSFQKQRMLREELLNLPFRAAGECAEEAILQSMWHAEEGTALDGAAVPSLKSFLKPDREKETE